MAALLTKAIAISLALSSGSAVHGLTVHRGPGAAGAIPSAHRRVLRQEVPVEQTAFVPGMMCQSMELQLLNHEGYDIHNCTAAAEGATCTVQCAPQYSGRGAQFVCARGGDGQLAWTVVGDLPQCALSGPSVSGCPDMPAPTDSHYDTSGCHASSPGATCVVVCHGDSGVDSHGVFRCEEVPGSASMGNPKHEWKGEMPVCTTSQESDANQNTTTGTGCALPQLDPIWNLQYECDDDVIAHGGVLAVGESCGISCSAGSVLTEGDEVRAVTCSEQGILLPVHAIVCTPLEQACKLPDFGAPVPATNDDQSSAFAPGASIERGTCVYDYLHPGQSCHVSCTHDFVNGYTGTPDMMYTCSQPGQLAQPPVLPLCQRHHTCNVSLSVPFGDYGTCAYVEGIPSGVTCEYGCREGYAVDPQSASQGLNQATCDEGVVNPVSYQCLPTSSQKLCPPGRFCSSLPECGSMSPDRLLAPDGLLYSLRTKDTAAAVFAAGGILALQAFGDSGVATVATLKKDGFGGDGAKAACTELVPLIQDDPDAKVFYMFTLPIGDKGVCAAMRPCAAGGHEYLFGFNKFEAKLKAGVLDVTLALNRFGYWNGGNNFTSNNPVWMVENYNSMPEPIKARRNIHVGASGEIGLPELGKDITATIKVSGTLDIDLDPAGDGFGGNDHAVMIQAHAGLEMKVTKYLKFDFPGTADVMVYWRYITPADYQINFMFQSKFNLAGLAGSIKINIQGSDKDEDFVDFGKFFAKIQIVDVAIDARLEVSILKRPEWAKPRWGLRVFGSVTLRIFGEDVLHVGGGLMLQGLETGQTGMALVRKDGQTQALPICFTHGGCPAGYACILGSCKLRPPCDCDYHVGGCSIYQNTQPGVACKCKYLGAWHCTGEQVPCSDKNSIYCTSNDPEVRKSAESCLFGGGNCKGYRKELPLGAVCSADKQCESESCGRAMAGVSPTCCKYGKVMIGVLNYCSGLEDGTACVGDAMCASGYCKGVDPNTGVGRCTARLPVGASCDANADCFNHACGRSSAADGSTKVCCPSDVSGLYWGYGYCYGLNDGATCWSDAMCKSKNCRGNSGGTKKGVCASPQPAGSSCVTSDDCQNAACGRATAAGGAPLVCCPSGRRGLYAGYYYCRGMADGSVCWSDAMCQSKFCKGNNGGLSKGVCTSAKPAGAPCNEDQDCQLGACARQTADKGQVLTCCYSGVKGLYAGYNYCYVMGDGSTCWSDAMCESRYCKGNMGGLKRGTCTRK